MNLRPQRESPALPCASYLAAGFAAFLLFMLGCAGARNSPVVSVPPTPAPTTSAGNRQVATTYSVSGTITGGSGGIVTLSGPTTAVIAVDRFGNYAFAGLADGTYTVTPGTNQCLASVQPLKQDVTVNGANIAGVNFTGADPNLKFCDDFSGIAPASPSWFAMNEMGRLSNGELQCYVPSADVISGGLLDIVTSRQNVTCEGNRSSYASGEVESVLAFTYGTLEYRAQMSGGQGAWPAIWLLGHNCQPVKQPVTRDCPWPQPGSDEIDITEVMNQSGAVNQQIHSTLGNPGCSATGLSDVTKNFHVYQLVWTANSMTWKVDGNTTCTQTSAIPQQAMFIIMNNAVGGSGGGSTINSSSMPWHTYVDYIRITQP